MRRTRRCRSGRLPAGVSRLLCARSLGSLTRCESVPAIAGRVPIAARAVRHFIRRYRKGDPHRVPSTEPKPIPRRASAWHGVVSPVLIGLPGSVVFRAFVLRARFPFESCTTMAQVFRFAPRRLSDWNILPPSAAKAPQFWPVSTGALWPLACRFHPVTAERRLSSLQLIARKAALPATALGWECRSIRAGALGGNLAPGASGRFSLQAAAGSAPPPPREDSVTKGQPSWHRRQFC